MLFKALSLLCLAQILVVTTLAAAPGLHRHVHHDADHANHHCVVTILAAGQVDAASDTPSISRPYFVAIAPMLTPTAVFISVDYQLLPGRAPPLFV
jgi:hypothetical protein